MLILDDNSVEYCQASSKAAGKEKSLPGVIYRNNLFVLAKTYEQDGLEEAIRECRELYLDNEEEQIPTVIVKQSDRITLWRQDNSFQIDSTTKTEPTPTSNQPDLQELATAMRKADGVPIKARRHKLKLYQRCFVGNEAVSWISQHLNISRLEALAVGQKMMEQKIFHHVVDEHPFEDQEVFYRFYDDEGKSIWTDKII